MKRKILLSGISNSRLSIINNVCLTNEYNQLFYSEPLYEVDQVVSTLMIYGRFNKKCTKVNISVLIDGMKSMYRINNAKFLDDQLLVEIEFYKKGTTSKKIKFDHNSGDRVITRVILKGIDQENNGILPPKICDTLFI